MHPKSRAMNPINFLYYHAVALGLYDKLHPVMHTSWQNWTKFTI